MAGDATKLAYWAGHIKNWEASKLARRAYCEREGLKLPTFDYWQRRVRPKADAARKRLPSVGLTLVPVRVTNKPGNDAIVLRSPSGWETRLPMTIDPAWLTAVLKHLP